ncbi:unnamed protein product [Arabis nemorensis]|uniref:Uncharacterized protein n=1 Tax=Arabis nemorensis TaxID=586526 RepID=A0A565CB85_9BRAS|nr:unnamed protein product [Arabis nemorensis]
MRGIVSQAKKKGEEELGRPFSFGEVFVRTHTSKDGTFVDKKAKQVADEYDKRLAEAIEQQAGDGADDQDISSEISTQQTLTIEEKNNIFLQCTEFDQKGNPFGIGGLSQKFNKGKKKISYETSHVPELAEMQEELKSARRKLAEHDEENKRRDEELKELRQRHARVSELEKLLSFLKKDNPRITAYMSQPPDLDSTQQPTMD